MNYFVIHVCHEHEIDTSGCVVVNMKSGKYCTKHFISEYHHILLVQSL